MTTAAQAVVSAGPMQRQIESKLTAAFAPTVLSVVNESFKHSVPRGSETHFNVTVVSDRFDNVALIDRHRLVNAALHDELQNGVHALAINAKSPAQWAKNATANETPNCLGGSKKS
jgi:stress-induced morphogen